MQEKKEEEQKIKREAEFTLELCFTWERTMSPGNNAKLSELTQTQATAQKTKVHTFRH